MKTTMRILLIIIGLALVCIAGFVVFTVQRVEDFPSGEIPVDSEIFDARYDDAAAQALKGLEGLRRERNWPSLSMAVGVDGKLVWAGAVGYADLAGATPVSTHHRYRVGSIAKPMTAVALGALLDEHKLALDENVNELLNLHLAKLLSVRQLASHTAGIRHYASGYAGLAETYNQTQYNSVEASLVLFKNDPLSFTPGTQYQYSSFGYNLLSRVLEVADGRKFLDLMQTRVFDPAGMSQTQAEHLPANAGATPDSLVIPYLMYDEIALRAPEVNNSYKWAGGGFISTPSDLVRFGLNLLSDDLVSATTRKQLWTLSQLSDGTPSPGQYALGFQLGEDQGEAFVGHGGSSVGGNSYFVIYPESGLVAAAVANTSTLSGSWNIRPSTRLLARLFLN